jgi:hypothetical protein
MDRLRRREVLCRMRHDVMFAVLKRAACCLWTCCPRCVLDLVWSPICSRESTQNLNLNPQETITRWGVCDPMSQRGAATSGQHLAWLRCHGHAHAPRRVKSLPGVMCARQADLPRGRGPAALPHQGRTGAGRLPRGTARVLPGCGAPRGQQRCGADGVDERHRGGAGCHLGGARQVPFATPPIAVRAWLSGSGAATRSWRRSPDLVV